jgi:hypothetical protein
LSFLQNDEPGFHDNYLVGEEGDFYFFLREDNKVFISARGLERLTSVSGRGNISRALQFFRKTELEGMLDVHTKPHPNEEKETEFYAINRSSVSDFLIEEFEENITVLSEDYRKALRWFVNKIFLPRRIIQKEEDKIRTVLLEELFEECDKYYEYWNSSGLRQKMEQVIKKASDDMPQFNGIDLEYELHLGIGKREFVPDNVYGFVENVVVYDNLRDMLRGESGQSIDIVARSTNSGIEDVYEKLAFYSEDLFRD